MMGVFASIELTMRSKAKCVRTLDLATLGPFEMRSFTSIT